MNSCICVAGKTGKTSVMDILPQFNSGDSWWTAWGTPLPVPARSFLQQPILEHFSTPALWCDNLFMNVCVYINDVGHPVIIFALSA